MNEEKISSVLLKDHFRPSAEVYKNGLGLLSSIRQNTLPSSLIVLLFFSFVL